MRVEAGEPEAWRGDTRSREAVRAVSIDDVLDERLGVSSRGTSRSGTCTVARTTRSGSEWNIIAARGARQVTAAGRCVPSRAARARERLLVDRRRRDGIDAPRLRIAHGGDDGVVGSVAGRCAHAAGRERREVGRRMRAVDVRLADRDARIVRALRAIWARCRPDRPP